MKMTIAQVTIFFTFMISSQVARAPVSYLILAQSNCYTNARDPQRAKRTCFEIMLARPAPIRRRIAARPALDVTL
jgi:hypothetical protein